MMFLHLPIYLVAYPVSALLMRYYEPEATAEQTLLQCGCKYI